MRCCVSLVLGLLVLPALAWGQAQVINGNRVHAGWLNYGTTAGTATAYTLTFTPALAGYVTGQCFLVKPHVANTGAATLNVQGKGAVTITKASGGSLVPVVAGDLPLGRLLQVCHDGTAFQLMGAAPDAASGGGLPSDPGPCLSNTFVTDVAQDGTLTCTQPSFANLSGTASDAQIPALATLGAGLTPSRCVETDGSGNLGVASGLCGTAGGTTGISGATNRGLMVATGATTATSLSAATNGQIPIGATGTIPLLGSITGTANQLRVTPGPGTIALDFPPAGVTLPGTTTANLGGATNLPLSTGVTGLLPYANLPAASAAARLLGRGSSGAGPWEEVSLGPGLTMSGTTLNTVAAGESGIVCDGVTMVSAAIQNLLDTAPWGTKIILPPGSCMLNQALTVTRYMGLQGAGLERTFLTQTVANIPVLTVSASNVRIDDLTVMHNVTPVAGGDGLVVLGPGGAGLNAVTLTHVMAKKNWRGIVLGPVYYSQAAHVWAMNNDSHGFEFTYDALAGGVSQWDILHASSQLNKGSGFFGSNTAAANGIGPWITQSLSFANEFGGFSFSGTPEFPISDIRLTHVIASTDNRGGIYLSTGAGSHIITNPQIENAGLNGGMAVGSAGTLSVATNTGHGLAATSNNTYGVMIVGGLFWNNAWSGVFLQAPHSQLIGGQSINNGLALDPGLHNRASIHIGADDVVVSGHTFQHTGQPGTIHYVYMAGALTHSEIGHNAYDSTLARAQWVNASGVAGSFIQLPTFAAGLEIHTGAPQAFGLSLYDALHGPTPFKYLRVAGGQLQVLNTSVNVVHSLSDEGTPGWPTRRGQLVISETTNTGTVTLAPGEPDSTYFVQLTAQGLTPGGNLGSLTVLGITKAASTFTVTLTAAPGVGKNVAYDWFVYR